MEYIGPVDSIHLGIQGFGFGASETEVRRYQTFIAPRHNHGIWEIRAKLRLVSGSPSNGIQVSLYETDRHKPTGSSIAQCAISPAAGPPPGLKFSIVRVSFQTQQLAEGREYAIVLSALDSDCRYEWAVMNVDDRIGFGTWDDKVHDWVDESNFGDAWMQVTLSDVPYVLDLSHDGISGFTFGATKDEIARYQTFLAPGARPIVGVDVKLRKLERTGTAQTDVVVELYLTDDHKPYGPHVASATIPAACIGTEWTVVNAPLHVPELDFECEYAVLLRQRTPGASVYEWATAETNRVNSFGKLRGTEWVDESQFGGGWLTVWFAPHYGTTIVDLSHSGTEGKAFGSEGLEVARYQTFTIGAGTITGVDLCLRRVSGRGMTQSDITCTLLATDHGKPTGAPLAIGRLGAFAVGEGWSIVHVPLKSGALPKGQYAVMLSQVQPSAACFEWAVGPGNESFGRSTGTAIIDESTLGNGWLRVWTMISDIDIDFSHDGKNGFGFGNTDGESKRWELFTTPAGDYFVMNGVQLKVRRYGEPAQSDLVVELFATSGNLPTGEPLTMAVVPSSIIGDTWTVVNVPLFYGHDHGGTLEAGQQYAIVVSQRVPSQSRYEWLTGTTARQTRFGQWNGGAWIDESALGTAWMKVWLVARSNNV